MANKCRAENNIVFRRQLVFLRNDAATRFRVARYVVSGHITHGKMSKKGVRVVFRDRSAPLSS